MDYSRLLKNLPPNFDVLIPFLRFEKELERELLLKGYKILFKNDYIFLTENLKSKPIWAQDWNPDSRLYNFSSRSEALKILRDQPHMGCCADTGLQTKLSHSLLKDLRELRLKRIQYKVPSDFNFKYFVWGTLDESHFFICSKPTSQFPLGWHEFNEDKNTPPNRAYLKIWETLCLGYISLKKNDIALDLGASPGGWTWALSEQIQLVYSIDKAPLDSAIISDRTNITCYSEDAFQVRPDQFTHCNWLFSDIICTPQRLYSLVQLWLKESKIQNYVCTIKFKGPCDFEILNEFLQIPNSRIIHLYQNKNEVTWIRQVKNE